MTQSPDANVLDVRRARGQALRTARTAAGLSARKLVERVNDRTGGSDITEHAIYAYESGRVQLSREVAERVAEVLRVPLGGLLVGDPDFLPSPPSVGSGGSIGVDPKPEPATPRAGASEGPAEAGRWAASRVSLLSRFTEAEPAAAVLVRQLSSRRFQLPDPVIFAASFELLDADLSALLASPEAAWLRLRERDAWHEPMLELLDAAQALRDAAMASWGRLQGAAATGGAAAACGPAREAIETGLGDLRDRAGRVRRLVAAGAPAPTS